MPKAALSLIICSFLLSSCDKKAEPTDPLAQLATVQIEVPAGITGNCIDALKAYHQVINYMYDDPSSKNYNRKSPSERAKSLENMTNTLKSRSQEQCKELAYNLITSIDDLKNSK